MDALRERLAELESDYPGMPVVAQKADLVEINRIRGELGMPAVDARLVPVGADRDAAPAPRPVRAKPDHSRAKELYAAWVKKEAELAPHREYAERVCRVTSGPGMTPVEPLATGGTRGGPLLCDRCLKPIVLEGGSYHGVNADDAWRRHPNPDGLWRSYIKGGVVVQITDNGTLRVYHGYPGGDQRHCCNAAEREAQAAFDSHRRADGVAEYRALWEWLADERPDLDDAARSRLVNDVLNGVFGYDPGVGVNQPG